MQETTAPSKFEWSSLDDLNSDGDCYDRQTIIDPNQSWRDDYSVDGAVQCTASRGNRAHIGPKSRIVTELGSQVVVLLLYLVAPCE